MSNIGLNLIITARDAASGVIRNIKGELASGLAAMRAYNAENANGNIALEKLTALGAGLGIGATMRSSVQDALDARRATNQFDLALRAAGQGSAEFRQALLDQQSAMEALTGIQDEAIADTQRALLAAGAGANALRLTAAAADYAAAKQMDLKSATAQLALGLRSDSEELTRMGIILEKGKPRALALAEALERLYKGQAAGSNPSSALSGLMVQINRLKESLGESLLGVLEPMAEGITAEIREWAKEGKMFTTDQRAFWREAGATVARLAKPALWIGGAIALKVALEQGLGVIRMMVVLVASLGSAVGTTQILTTWQRMSKEIGTWSAMMKLGNSEIGLATKLTAGLGVVALGVGAFLAGWTIGNLLNEIEVGGFKISEWAEVAMIQFWAIGKDAADTFEWIGNVIWTTFSEAAKSVQIAFNNVFDFLAAGIFRWKAELIEAYANVKELMGLDASENWRDVQVAKETAGAIDQRRKKEQAGPGYLDRATPRIVAATEAFAKALKENAQWQKQMEAGVVRRNLERKEAEKPAGAQGPSKADFMAAIRAEIMGADWKGPATKDAPRSSFTLAGDSSIRQGLAAGNVRSSLEVSATTRIASNSEKQVELLRQLVAKPTLNLGPAVVGP